MSNINNEIISYNNCEFGTGTPCPFSLLEDRFNFVSTFKRKIGHITKIVRIDEKDTLFYCIEDFKRYVDAMDERVYGRYVKMLKDYLSKNEKRLTELLKTPDLYYINFNDYGDRKRIEKYPARFRIRINFVHYVTQHIDGIFNKKVTYTETYDEFKGNMLPPNIEVHIEFESPIDKWWHIHYSDRIAYVQDEDTTKVVTFKSYNIYYVFDVDEVTKVVNENYDRLINSYRKSVIYAQNDVKKYTEKLKELDLKRETFDVNKLEYSYANSN